jgi:hypothetical protein
LDELPDLVTDRPIGLEGFFFSGGIFCQLWWVSETVMDNFPGKIRAGLVGVPTERDNVIKGECWEFFHQL